MVASTVALSNGMNENTWGTSNNCNCNCTLSCRLNSCHLHPYRKR